MRPVIVLAGLWPVLSAAAGEAVTLDDAAWGTASPATVLSGQKPMRRLVQDLESRPEAILVIRHASAETDRSRATALQAALVALGIPAARLRLDPAAAPPGSLIVELAVPPGY